MGGKLAVAHLVGRDDEDAVGLRVGYVDDTQVAAGLGLTDDDAGVTRATTLLGRIAEDLVDLVLEDVVGMDVRLSALRVEIEAEVHAP